MNNAEQRVVDAARRFVHLRDLEREAQRVGQQSSSARPLASSPPHAVFTRARRELDQAVHDLGGRHG